MLIRFILLIFSFLNPPLVLFLLEKNSITSRIVLVIWCLSIVVFFKISFGIGVLIFIGTAIYSSWILIVRNRTYDLKSLKVKSSEITNNVLINFFHLGVLITFTVGGLLTFQNELDVENVLDREYQKRGAIHFDNKCKVCHTLSGKTLVGPPLNGILGKQIGSSKMYNYSEAMNNSSLKWTEISLTQFLKNPNKFLPGTRMAISPSTDEEISELIDFLKIK